MVLDRTISICNNMLTAIDFKPVNIEYTHTNHEITI